eukprot:2673614-Pyramimonas_sp.AAC.1
MRLFEVGSNAMAEEEQQLDGKWTRKAAAAIWDGFGFGHKGYITAEEYVVFVVEVMKAQIPLENVLRMDIPSANYSFEINDRRYTDSTLKAEALQAFMEDFKGRTKMDMEHFV